MNTPIILNGEHLPKPEGSQECDFCKEKGVTRKFPNWDQIAIHITLVHNDNGRKRSFYNGKPSKEILEHEDWTGFEDE